MRDEEDILDANIRHHFAQGVDGIIVTDNASRDATPAILRAHEGEGRLRVIHEPGRDYRQAEWVTRMARMAAEREGADWVINADADEFFLCRGGSLRAALAAVAPEVTMLRAGRHDFVPIERPGAAPPPAEMIYRKAASTNHRGAPLPPKLIHRADPHVEVAMGNHTARGPRLTGESAPCEVEVFHYPIRGYARFARKIRDGASAIEANTQYPPGAGAHWRRWRQMLDAGELEREYRERIFFDDARLRDALDVGELIEDRFLARSMMKSEARSPRL